MRTRSRKFNEAAKKVEDGIREALTYCDFSSEHRIPIHPNNVIERLNRGDLPPRPCGGSFPHGNPDITFLPALANILETSIDTLIGMDAIRAEETRLSIHAKASAFQRTGNYSAAEKVYRDALLTYPNKPGMILGLAGVLALQGNSEEAVELIGKGLPLSLNEKQKSTMRAVLCFLYLKCGKAEKAAALASTLPHTRESREVIQPLISKGLNDDEIIDNIKNIVLGC